MAPIVLAAGLPSIAAPAQAQTTLCDPVMIIPFRGSGESVGDNKPSPATYGNVSTAGWEGDTNARLLQTLYSEYPEARDVPIIDIPAPDYPSVEVARLKEAVSATQGNITNSPVYRSSQKGVTTAMRQMLTAMKLQPAECPLPKFIVLGYSQGAMAARQLAVATKDLDVVAGVFLAGDPYQRANESTVYGTGRTGNGIFRQSYPKMTTTFDEFYEIADFPVVSVCHDFDPICDIEEGKPPAAEAPHLNYYKADVPWQYTPETPAEMSESEKMAEAIAEVVRDVKYSSDAPTGPYARSVVKDTMFAIDTTGSMSSLIRQARDAADELGSRLVSSDGRSRVGLVEYRDHGDAFVARTVVPLTNDLAGFRAGLSGLSAAGGGDTPEAVFSGINEALGASWNPIASRSIVVMGDAPAHNPEPVTNFTDQSIISAMKGLIDLDIRPLESGRAGALGAEPSGDRSQPESVPDTNIVSTRAASQADTLPSSEVRAYADSPPGLPVALYGMSTSSTLVGQLTAIADETDGEVHPLNGSSAVTDALASALNRIDQSPIPVLVSTGAIVAGVPTQLDCSLSMAWEGGVTVSADLDGDGTYEAPCTDGVVTVTFDSAGPHSFRIKATDDAAREAQTVVTVQVVSTEDATSVVEDDSGASTGSLGSTSSLANLFGS